MFVTRDWCPWVNWRVGWEDLNQRTQRTSSRSYLQVSEWYMSVTWCWCVMLCRANIRRWQANIWWSRCIYYERTWASHWQSGNWWKWWDVQAEQVVLWYPWSCTSWTGITSSVQPAFIILIIHSVPYLIVYPSTISVQGQILFIMSGKSIIINNFWLPPIMQRLLWFPNNVQVFDRSLCCVIVQSNVSHWRLCVSSGNIITPHTNIARIIPMR